MAKQVEISAASRFHCIREGGKTIMRKIAL
jgi:hypothetical protein